MIAALTYRGDAKAAFAKLIAIARDMCGATVVSAEPGYLYAQFQAPLM